MQGGMTATWQDLDLWLEGGGKKIAMSSLEKIPFVCLSLLESLREYIPCE